MDGYEWKTVTVTFIVDDENGWNYGCHTELSTDDYYYGELEYEFGENYTLNYNGIDYNECLCEYEYVPGEWIEQVCTIKYIFTMRIHEGYDGLVVGISSDATKDEEVRDINFRFNSINVYNRKESYDIKSRF